jgi:hypothetical protein
MANQILYGFHNLQDLAAERVTTVGVGVVNTAVDQAVAEHNRQMNALMDFFVTRTTDFKTRFKSVTGARLQGLDENGRARPIKPAGYYDIGLPLQMAGTAWGYDYVTGQKMTVGDVQRTTQTMLMADNRWVRDKILAALFDNDGWTFVDPEHGSLTILPLANGDTQVYQVFSGGDLGATSQHYLAQAAAIDDGADNPFPAIYSLLTTHPENGGEVVAFVPSNVVAAIEALATFRPVSDPNVREGSNTAVLTGSLGGTLPGNIIGYVDKVWIVEWRSLPDNYIIATTTEGDRPLAMREDPEASLRGFKKVADRDDHPFYERQYLRRAGFGGWNRVGAVVQRVGSGSYAIPTGYTNPQV